MFVHVSLCGLSNFTRDMFSKKRIEKSNYAISDGFQYDESEFQQTNRTGLGFCGISGAKDVREFS